MSKETLPLAGRRAFVTGGSKGIGAAIVKELCSKGADVVFAARDSENANAIVSETGAKAVIFDLLDLDYTHKVVSDNGPFDILINNAGMDQHSFFTETNKKDWSNLIGINLEAIFATTHAALPEMQKAGFGRIINISSEAGRIGSRGGAVYAAAKGGVHAFTKSIAHENGRFGITANAVCPGPIDTPLLRDAVQQGGEKLLESMKQSTVMNRLGTPEEVAALVVFLASPHASYITGEVIGASGGMGM